MAQISVIVPLYNVERYLQRCIDSILSQTFPDFEVVLVDDGSTDSSGTLCDAYAQRDSRIHVIHQKNSGVGVARNTGLDWAMANSDSRWITFVDSDDWAHPRMLEILRNTALEYDVPISARGYLETTAGELVVREEDLKVTCWNLPDFYRQQQILATVPWGKLYDKKCFETVRYPVGTYFDDEFVTYRLLFAQEFLPVVPAQLYGYFINPAGLTKRPWNPRRLEVWQAYEEQIEFFAQREDARMHRFRYREYIDNSYAQLQEACQAPNAGELKREIRYIRKSLRALIARARKFGYIEFWMDYDMLYACAPIRTKAYRLWLELKK